MTQRRDLATVIREFVDERVHRIRVAIPAAVEAYDAATQVADVAVQVQERVVDDDGETTWEAPPVIPAVPVAFPRAGGFFISFPVAKGDTGLLVFCDRSIDQWRAKGREAPNADGRFHELSDAVFYPGLVAEGAELANAGDTDLVLGHDAGNRLTITESGDILVGSNAAQYVALENLVKAELGKLRAWIDAMNTVISGPPITGGPGTTGGALQTAFATAVASLPASEGDVAAAKTKAE